MIVGTAGHIDHGKTALVHALTGVDTDRLPEEKRRGITIELGFAPLVLDGVGTVGVVDVPGHEAFVRTMVAGATGIDVALLVVAADEGVMPQTREHLAILSLLGVSNGVVAITKSDLVDADWLELVMDDVRAATAAALPNAPVVATSATTGHGIAELRSALTAAALAVPSRAQDDLFRLPIDRVFTIRGTGTVVTGTVWSGRVARDEAVRILPGARTARVRGIQAHGVQLDSSTAGSRTAVALVGVDVADVARGSTLVTDCDWHATTLARADVTSVEGAEAWLRPRAWLRFHVGTSEVGARVVSRDAKAGGVFAARLVLDAPVVLRAGDRFVLRSTSPLNTVGGGVITDPYAPKRARQWARGLTVSERLDQIVDESARQGVEVASLPVRLGQSPDEVRATLADARSRVVVVGERLVARTVVEELAQQLVAAATSFHAEHPLEVGIPSQLVRSKLRANSAVADAALSTAVAAERLTISGGFVQLRGWNPQLAGRDLEVADRVVARLVAAASEPPTVEELSVELGRDVAGVLRFIERQGSVVQVEQNRYYATGSLKSLVDRLRDALQSGAAEGRSPSELRDALGLSRKFLIPFLEYSDRVGYTDRRAEVRVWRK